MHVDHRLREPLEYEHHVKSISTVVHTADCLIYTAIHSQDKGKAADHKRNSSSSSSSSTAVELPQLAFLQYTSGSTRYVLYNNRLNYCVT
jgi:acyl-CoA synthetase (AMP-forming)/AMP-acid ligase II